MLGLYDLIGYFIILSTALIFGVAIGVPASMFWVFWIGLGLAATAFVGSGLYVRHVMYGRAWKQVLKGLTDK